MATKNLPGIMVAILLIGVCLCVLGCGSGGGGVSGGGGGEESSPSPSPSIIPNPTPNPSNSPNITPNPSPTYSPNPSPSPVTPKIWSVRRNGKIIEGGYGELGNTPQCIAFIEETNNNNILSGAWLRPVDSTECEFGPSINTAFCWWEAGSPPIYHQGAPVTATWEIQGSDLLIKYSGTSGGLSFQGTILINPPINNSITAIVTVMTTGNLNLAINPNQAFKITEIKSHTSIYKIDSSKCFVDSMFFPIPVSNWLIPSPITNTNFGLVGRTPVTGSKYTSTIAVTLNQPMPVTGWVDVAVDANSDNVSMWPGSDSLIRSWSYKITASKPESNPTPSPTPTPTPTPSPSPTIAPTPTPQTTPGIWEDGGYAPWYMPDPPETWISPMNGTYNLKSIDPANEYLNTFTVFEKDGKKYVHFSRDHVRYYDIEIINGSFEYLFGLGVHFWPTDGFAFSACFTSPTRAEGLLKLALAGSDHTIEKRIVFIATLE